MKAITNYFFYLEENEELAGSDKVWAVVGYVVPFLIAAYVVL